MEYQQFLNWLKTKKALDLYINEFNKFQQKLKLGDKFTSRTYWRKHVYRKTIEDVFNKHRRYVLNYSFRWLETGKYDFWSNLSEEFQELWNTNNL